MWTAKFILKILIYGILDILYTYYTKCVNKVKNPRKNSHGLNGLIEA